MNDFIKLIMDYAVTQPNKTALVDGGGAVSYTYRQINYLSGKVYAYLKSKNIGKEDFVAICLPRSAQPIIAMLGIWKAGAAFVILEENYAPERSNYIIKDCDCKLVIDNVVWADIQMMTSLDGHESVNAHDAALAIYTSGSTGMPKGVLHEFGSIDFMARSNRFHGVNNISHDEIDGLVAPMTFIAGTGACIMALMAGCTLHIIPYMIVKNPKALEAYMYEQKISKISLSPTLYRAIHHFSPHLKKIFMGGEPISRIYNDQIKIISAYSMSECGALIAAFEIDRIYDHTPIGKPQFDLNYWILDEDGKNVTEGECGELCIEVPYVRGYIHNPELTQKVFKDKIYHTGDLIKVLPDGNMVILGRNNDMIKINGNRVEPGEIEAAVRKLLGIDWACAKGFTDGHSAFICVYYVADIKIDYEKTRKELLKYLPYYMIPSHFIHLESIPKNENGKVDKKSLLPPELNTYKQDYVAPINEIQRKICHAFQQALKMEHIGIHDDFYQLGGDSLASMTVVAQSDIKGLGINEIFRGRTPEKIALLIEEKAGAEKNDNEELRAEKMRQPHRLTVEQIEIVDYQLYAPKSNMYNLAGLLRFEQKIDAQKLADAVNQAIDVHPALGTVFFFNEDGDLMQHYKPELRQKTVVENISNEALEKMKHSLIQPFKIINSSLCRARVFQTEDSVYLFIDIHHVIFDGTSSQIFIRDINDAYNGKTLKTKDFYFETLKKREDIEKTKIYMEAKKYFEEHYFDKPYQAAPTYDFDIDSMLLGSIYQEMTLSAKRLDQIEALMHLSRNEFFIAVTLLAIAQYNQTTLVKVNWIFNGRQTADEMQTVGYLLRIFPIAQELYTTQSIFKLFQSIRDQAAKGLEYSCYPYVNIIESNGYDDETEVIYQRDLKEEFSIAGVKAKHIELEKGAPAYENVFDIEIMNNEDTFDILVEYSTAVYKKESIERFCELFKEIAVKLTSILENQHLTVSDVIGDIK